MRLAFVVVHKPENDAVEASVPRIGILAMAAIMFAAGATLVLGIVPNEVLHDAQEGAYTLQAPTADAPMITVMPMQNP